MAIKVGGYEGLQNVNLLIPINLSQDLLLLVPDLQATKTLFAPGPPDLASRKLNCDSLQELQGNESVLVVMGEKAFGEKTTSV